MATLVATCDQDPTGKKYVMGEDPVVNTEVPIMYCAAEMLQHCNLLKDKNNQQTFLMLLPIYYVPGSAYEYAVYFYF